jgi:hypothetical protein
VNLLLFIPDLVSYCENRPENSNLDRDYLVG